MIDSYSICFNPKIKTIYINLHYCKTYIVFGKRYSHDYNIFISGSLIAMS